MQTSNFWNYPEGNNRIAICRAVPRGMKPGYRHYRKLAPGSWFNTSPYKDSQEIFAERYFDEILEPLNAAQEWEYLHQLSGGAEPVLLCWEHLHKQGEWCHRRMVADWFMKELGIDVPEYEVEKVEDRQLVLV